MRFFAREDEPPPPKAPKTHDYTIRGWGHDYAILKAEPPVIRISGWGYGLRAGDYLLLQGDAPGTTTRYRLDTCEYFHNPSDMWRATATFAPRVG